MNLLEESFLENKKIGLLLLVMLKDNTDLKLDIAEEIEDFRLEHEEMPMSKEYYLTEKSRCEPCV